MPAETTAQQWTAFNWDLVTTVAWDIGANETVCYAHQRGVRVVIPASGPFALYGGANIPAYLSLLLNASARTEWVTAQVRHGLSVSFCRVFTVFLHYRSCCPHLAGNGRGHRCGRRCVRHRRGRAGAEQDGGLADELAGRAPSEGNLGQCQSLCCIPFSCGSAGTVRG